MTQLFLEFAEPFEPLPDDFFEDLKAGLKTPFPCASCVAPLCSCSGTEKAFAIFLPGEKEWIERVSGREFKAAQPLGFTVCGDCTFLTTDYKCGLENLKPWDCETFPFQPELYNGVIIPLFAKNCTIHPHDVPKQWLVERVQGWEKILNAVQPEWLEFYASSPIHDGERPCSN